MLRNFDAGKRTVCTVYGGVPHTLRRNPHEPMLCILGHSAIFFGTMSSSRCAHVHTWGRSTGAKKKHYASSDPVSYLPVKKFFQGRFPAESKTVLFLGKESAFEFFPTHSIKPALAPGHHNKIQRKKCTCLLNLKAMAYLTLPSCLYERVVTALWMGDDDGAAGSCPPKRASNPGFVPSTRLPSGFRMSNFDLVVNRSLHFPLSRSLYSSQKPSAEKMHGQISVT